LRIHEAVLKRLCEYFRAAGRNLGEVKRSREIFVGVYRKIDLSTSFISTSRLVEVEERRRIP